MKIKIPAELYVKSLFRLARATASIIYRAIRAFRIVRSRDNIHLKQLRDAIIL